MDMSDEKKGTLHREIFFLPPLTMVLCRAEKEFRQNERRSKDMEKQEGPDEKTVAKLIEKLSEKDE